MARSAEKQAERLLKSLHKQGLIKSVGSTRNLKSALTKIGNHFISNGFKDFRKLDRKAAEMYLEQRSQEIGQSALNLERQALQHVMRHVTNQLDKEASLRVIKSEHDQALTSRLYTEQQKNMIAERQTEANQLATEVAYSAGLRAHELHTLLPISERQPDDRPAAEQKFMGREGKLYTVIGKGGLCRAVVIPSDLALRLEASRLSEPQKVTDREVVYQSHYKIAGGNRWSNSFGKVSKTALGWSRGAHGLRHTYAQERMKELRGNGCYYEDALKVVSQEMGHFRPEITEVYLR